MMTCGPTPKSLSLSVSCQGCHVDRPVKRGAKEAAVEEVPSNIPPGCESHEGAVKSGATYPLPAQRITGLPD